MDKYFQKISNIEFALFLIVANRYVPYDKIAKKLHIGSDIISKYAATVYDKDPIQKRQHAKRASPERQQEIVEIILDELEKQAIDYYLGKDDVDDYENLIARCFNYLIPDTVLWTTHNEKEATDIMFDMHDFENSYIFSHIRRAMDDWNKLKYKDIKTIGWFNDHFELIFQQFRCDIEMVKTECYKSINPDYAVVLDRKVLDSEGCQKSFESLDMAIYSNELKQGLNCDTDFDEDQIEQIKRNFIRNAATYYAYRNRPYNDEFDKYSSYILAKTNESTEYPLYYDWSFNDFFEEVISIDANKWLDFARFRFYLDTIL